MIATHEAPTCSYCKKRTLFIFDKEDYENWMTGTEARHAFPYLTVDQLFTLLDGDHGECIPE